jgi:spore coat polysaccharide biosynthesis protein SpsF
MTYKTEQEAFWAGAFGDDYIGRNRAPELLASNLAFFSRALQRVRAPASCIEFGANVGMNLAALRLLYPSLEQHAIEINAKAADELEKVLPAVQVYRQSILEFAPSRQWDLVLIKGVLIHIDPQWADAAYKALHAATGRYLLVAEYYNPVPVAIDYRGHSNRLFKRDFCGEIMDRYPDLRLVDYGFAYRRDPSFPQDDITWFLLEKTA